MRVLVTGAEGFVGGHLVPALVGRGHGVVGTTLDGELGPRLCLPDLEGARQAIRDARPDVLVHLAAVAHVPDAARDPEMAYRVNVEGTVSLLRALHREAPEARFVFVSSSAIYGQVPAASQPITEEHGARPINAYGWSKFAAESALHSLAPALGIDFVILRPFNHTGPGQPEDFVLPGFARQIVELERRGDRGVIRVGDLSVRRDILDVRDVVEAYARVVESPELKGTFNIAGGVDHRLSELLERMCENARRELSIEVDPERLRPNDQAVLRGDATRFRDATGWEPRIPMARTLADLVESWRARLDSSP